MKKYILLLSALTLFFGCSEFTSEKKYNEDYYVITGLLQAGKSVNKDNPVFIGKTISAEDGNLFDIYIENAEVWIENLALSDTIPLHFFVQADSLNPIFGYYDPDSTIIEAATEYQIIARIQNENDEIAEVRAKTKVPKDIIINPDNDPVFATDLLPELPQLDYDNANIEHPLMIQTSDADPVNLKFRFYCLEEYQNAEYIFPFADQDYPEDAEEYEGTGNEFPRNSWYIADYLPAQEEDRFIIRDQGYKSNFIFYGKYQISIVVIDENYYKYLYKMNGYLHGGIENGYGYFGSINGDTIYTELIE